MKLPLESIIKSIYEECKDEFNDTYNNFFEITQSSHDNYTKIQKVLKIYPQFKKEGN